MTQPNSWAARDAASLMHHHANLSRHEQDGPLIIRRGKSVRVQDEDGRWYLEEMAELWCASLVTHGITYATHPACAAVALETLRIYKESDIVGRVQDVGLCLQNGLRDLLDHPLIGHARGVGLTGSVEIVVDETARTHFPAEFGVSTRVQAAALPYCARTVRQYNRCLSAAHCLPSRDRRDIVHLARSARRSRGGSGDCRRAAPQLMDAIPCST